MEGIVGEESSTSDRKVVHIAVGRDVKKDMKNLTWCIDNFRGFLIVLLHIHQPSNLVDSPLGGGKVPASMASVHLVRAQKEKDQQEMMEVLTKYGELCLNRGVLMSIETQESDSVGQGIVKFIRRNQIQRLVMGARCDRQMNKLTCEKAIYVMSNAPLTCEMLFVHNGGLMCFAKARSIEWASPTQKGFLSNMISRVFSRPQNTSKPKSETHSSPGMGTPKTPDIASPRPDNNLQGIAGSESTEPLLQVKNLHERMEILQRAKEVVEEHLKMLLAEKEIMHRELDEASHLLEETQGRLRATEDQLKVALTQTTITPSFLEFSFEELMNATDNFDETMRIGRGGFGIVYKGKLRNTVVAIKKLRQDSKQGEAELQREILTLSRVRHPNLVSLIGACPTEGCLVYEYEANGSLQDCLFPSSGRRALSWEQRFRIAGEICLGIMFLHSAKPYIIVHGDLKPSNILLNENYKVKISDFGISRFLPQPSDTDDAQTISLETESAFGSEYYMDPDFRVSKKLTKKADVYAFGVILLQLMTGRPPRDLVEEVSNKGNCREFLVLIDGNSVPHELAEQLMDLALRCCDLNRKNRPDLESEVWPLLQDRVSDL